MSVVNKYSRIDPASVPTPAVGFVFQFLDQDDGKMYVKDSNGAIFSVIGTDISVGLISDTDNVESISVLDRWAYTSTGQVSYSWENKACYDDNGDAAIDWRNRLLRENSDNAVSIDWQLRYLGDSNETSALDWEERHLQSGGANRISWSGGLGFYGTTPIAQPTSSGATTAGGTYGATEQSMLQQAYNALRALGLMT